MDISEFSDENQSEARAVIASYTYSINSSDDYSEIDEYVEQAKDKLNDIYEKEHSEPEISDETPSSSMPESSPSSSSEDQSSEQDPDISSLFENRDNSNEETSDISE